MGKVLSWWGIPSWSHRAAPQADRLDATSTNYRLSRRCAGLWYEKRARKPRFGARNSYQHSWRTPGKPFLVSLARLPDAEDA